MNIFVFITGFIVGSICYMVGFYIGKQRNLFLKENEDLVKDYLMIE